MKKLLICAALLLTGCTNDADVVSKNLSTDADNFKIERRVVFYNGITGEYILSIEGKCAIDSSEQQNKLTVTCKVGDDQYKKHFLGLSDNVTYFAEQLDYKSVSTYNYKVTFKPQVIAPNINLKTSITN